MIFTALYSFQSAFLDNANYQKMLPPFLGTSTLLGPYPIREGDGYYPSRAAMPWDAEPCMESRQQELVCPQHYGVVYVLQLEIILVRNQAKVKANANIHSYKQ